MYRFFAMSWNSKDATRTAAARQLARDLPLSSPDWQGIFDAPGFLVFHAPHPGGAFHAYTLKDDTGVVLGRLFDGNIDNGHIPTDPTFDSKESKLVIESDGRRLVDRYWGHYVAFLRGRDSKRRFVLRDPTGGLPCFITKAAGIDLILSDMEDCARLSHTPFSVDWGHLAAFFLHMRLITRTTGFKEVAQLQAGECAAIADDGAITTSFYWDPVDVCEGITIENPNEARAELRNAVQHCVNAWASCYGSILHELSGGLDSSIIAACLAKASVRPEVLCFHYFTEMSEGDEREYARAAAQSSGWELVEHKTLVSERTLKSQLNPSRIATPAVQGFLPGSELLKQRLVTERGAGAVFSGQGGDHLFQEGRSKFIAAEYVHRHGLRPPLLGIVADTSRLTKQPISAIFAAAIRYGLFKRSYNPYSTYEPPPIFTDSACALVNPEAYSHPWVERAKRLPAAKIQHIYNVVDCQPFHLVSCPYAEQIHPLISQPIIERSLQIPTYILAHRGKARGLIREAFEGEVPAKIIHRRSKGATTSYFNRMLVGNADFLREFLLDGVLVREGMLDRRELEKQLSERELVRGDGRRYILNAVRAEAWLSNWIDTRQRTAA